MLTWECTIAGWRIQFSPNVIKWCWRIWRYNRGYYASPSLPLVRVPVILCGQVYSILTDRKDWAFYLGPLSIVKIP